MNKELEVSLNGTPDMVIECITNLVKSLNAKGDTYAIRRTSGAPDYAKWDRTYSAHYSISFNRRDMSGKECNIPIGDIKLILIPGERTLLTVKEPQNWEGPLGHFLSHLFSEFERLGFVQFEGKKPPIGFRLPHKET